MADWRRRIDRVVLVTAPDDTKIARYVGTLCYLRVGSRSGRGRCAVAPGAPDPRRGKGRSRRYVIENTGDIEALRARSRALAQLEAESNLNIHGGVI